MTLEDARFSTAGGPTTPRHTCLAPLGVGRPVQARVLLFRHPLWHTHSTPSLCSGSTVPRVNAFPRNAAHRIERWDGGTEPGGLPGVSSECLHGQSTPANRWTLPDLLTHA